MGKSFLFECTKCGYRAVAAGGRTEGNDLKVQTIVCKDCRSIYDCVVSLRVDATPQFWKSFAGLPQEVAPSVQSALARLRLSSIEASEWRECEPACPVDATHRFDLWTAPDRCPRCKAYLEGGGIPYRVWD